MWRSGDRSDSRAGGAQRVDAERAAEHNAEAAAERRLAVSENVISEPDARPDLQVRRIEIAAAGDNTGKRVAGIAGGIECALLGIRIKRAGVRVDRRLVGDGATGSGGHGDRAIGEQELPFLALVKRR